MVKCDGSGRVLLRNRAHLRKIDPSTRKSSSIDHPSPTSRKDAIGPAPLHVPDQLQDGTHILPPMDIDGEDISVGAGGEDISTTVTDNIETVVNSDPVVEHFAPTQEVPLRRSERARKARKILSPVMHGKRHEEVELEH